MIEHNPTFTVFVGPMMSSKTSKLLMTLERHKYQHKNVVAFKPQMDDRYSVEDIVSHGGWKFPATCVKFGADILEVLSNMDVQQDVIAVDEAFMIDGVAEALAFLFKNGFTVVVSTLDLSATGKPFKEVEKMLPWATSVEKCTAVCTVCGRDAAYTHKKHTGGDEIEVGGTELYEPRCWAHEPFIANNL